MKYTKFILIGLTSILSHSLQAALSYNLGDIYLGFRQIGNTTADFAVNLGPATQFRDALAPITLTLTNLNSVLSNVNVFGANWATDANIRWGLVGTNQNNQDINGDPVTNDPTRTLYTTKATGGAAPTSGSLSAQAVPANNIVALFNYYSNNNGPGGNGVGTLTESAVNNGSVGSPGNANSVSTRYAASFSFSNISPVEAQFTTSNGLDLYLIAPSTTASKEGNFVFNPANNQLTFTPTSVPEPSSIVLAGLALGGFGLLLRKRSKISA